MTVGLLLTLVLCYFFGALPLAYGFARWRGLEPRLAAPYNIGFENALRVMGQEASIASFLLDFFKGVLVVGLAAPFVGNEPGLLAGLVGYIGHLYPPPFFFRRGLRGENVPIRGRGNVVLLGVLAGLTVYAGLPFWLAALPVLVWTAVVAYSRLVALGTLAGVAVLALELWASPLDFWGRFAVLALAAAASWRFKENIGRMLERTEPRLGERIYIAGERQDQIVTAFIIHPLGPEWFWRSERAAWLKPFYRRGWINYEQISRIGMWFRPFKVGELRGIYTSDGKEIRCHLLSAPFAPEVFKTHPELATKRAIQGARLAKELGASTYGLGAFWGTVGKKGLEVQQAVPEICVTNGGAYTAGSIRAAVPQILEHFRALGRDPKTSTVAVVGANGVVAFGMARMIASEVGRVILIGRDLERLAKSQRTLEKAYPQTEFFSSIDAGDCVEADLIFTATSDPNPVIFAKDIKPGTWIYDEGRPDDCDPSVLEVPGVRVIPGGVVMPPGSMTGTLDWATGRLGFGNGSVPACLAETLIIAANHAYERQSLGETTKTEHINYFIEEAERLGFRVLEKLEPTAYSAVTSPAQHHAVLN